MRLTQLNHSGLDDAQMAEYNLWCADTGVPEVDQQNAVLCVPSTKINPWLSSRFQKETNDYLFSVGEQGYYSAEHYLQADKINLLLAENDHLQLGLDVNALTELRNNILNTASVKQAVAITKEQANYVCQGQTNNSENTPRSINDLLNKTSWYKSQRFCSLKTATKLKFEQNDELRELLLATGDAHIIGFTPRGSGASCTWGTAYENGEPGQNQLGCILMEVRIGLLLSEYKEQPSSEYKEQPSSEYKEQPSEALTSQCRFFQPPQEVEESSPDNGHIVQNAI